MKRDEIAAKLHSAIAELFEQHGYLLEIDANERSVTHHLAERLKTRFNDWDVDCEYNRNQHMPKILNLPIPGGSPQDTDARTVYPDVIVHRRGTENNLLVIEVKKASNKAADDMDRMKLNAFVSQLGYRHGVFIKFVVGPEGPDFSEEWVGEQA